MLASKKLSNCDSDSEQYNCLRSRVTSGSSCSSSNSWLFWLEGTTLTSGLFSAKEDRLWRMEYDSSLLPLICEEHSSSGNRPFNGCSTATHDSLWEEGTKLELTNRLSSNKHSCELHSSSSFSVVACPRKKDTYNYPLTEHFFLQHCIIQCTLPHLWEIEGMSKEKLKIGTTLPARNVHVKISDVFKFSNSFYLSSAKFWTKIAGTVMKHNQRKFMDTK